MEIASDGQSAATEQATTELVDMEDELQELQAEMAKARRHVIEIRATNRPND